MIYYHAATKEKYLADYVSPENEDLIIVRLDGAYRVVNLITGKPFVRSGFATKEMAMALGHSLLEWYGEYLWVNRDPDWREKDLPTLLQYTIPHGQEKVAFLEQFRYYDRVITEWKGLEI